MLALTTPLVSLMVNARGAMMKTAIKLSVCCAALLGCNEADKTHLKKPIEISYYFCEGKRTYLSEELREETGGRKVEEVKHILGFRRERVNLPDKSYITSEIYIDGTYGDAEANTTRREKSEPPLSILNESLGNLSFFQETAPGRSTSLQRTIEFNFFNKRGSVDQTGARERLHYRDVFSCREITDPKELREVPNKMDDATLGSKK